MPKRQHGAFALAEHDGGAAACYYAPQCAGMELTMVESLRDQEQDGARAPLRPPAGQGEERAEGVLPLPVESVVGRQDGRAQLRRGSTSPEMVLRLQATLGN